MKDELLKEILQELKDMHSHLDNLESLYKFTNRVEMKKEEVKKEIVEDKKWLFCILFDNIHIIIIDDIR